MTTVDCEARRISADMITTNRNVYYNNDNNIVLLSSLSSAFA